MVECLLGCESLVHVFHDEALQEVFRLLGMLREGLVLEVELTLDDIANNLQL